MPKTYYDDAGRMFKVIESDVGGRQDVHRYSVRFCPGTGDRSAAISFSETDTVMLFKTKTLKTLAIIVVVQQIRFKAGRRSAEIVAQTLTHVHE
jgi:hypothetical protein